MRRLGWQQWLDGRPELVRDELFGMVRVVDEVATARDPSAPRPTL
jgi:hypothetical protein